MQHAARVPKQGMPSSRHLRSLTVAAGSGQPHKRLQLSRALQVGGRAAHKALAGGAAGEVACGEGSGWGGRRGEAEASGIRRRPPSASTPAGWHCVRHRALSSTSQLPPSQSALTCPVRVGKVGVRHEVVLLEGPLGAVGVLGGGVLRSSSGGTGRREGGREGRMKEGCRVGQRARAGCSRHSKRGRSRPASELSPPRAWSRRR